MPYLLWDFDNTLAHRPGMWSQCLVDAANADRGGPALTRERLSPHLFHGFPWHTPAIGHPHLSTPDAWWSNLMPTLVHALVVGGGVDHADAVAIAARLPTEYTRPEKWVVFEDTKPALTALSQLGWRHAILSNHVPELGRLVSDLGLAEHFEFVLTSAQLGYEKPHRLAFEAAMRRLPEHEQPTMIGDNFVADYTGARAAGLNAILVRSMNPECSAAFPDLSSLVRHLREA